MALMGMIKNVSSGGESIEDMLLNGQYTTAQSTSSWGAVTVNIPSGAKYAIFLCDLTERGGTRVPLADTFTDATLISAYFDSWTSGATSANTSVICSLKLNDGATSFIFNADSRDKSAKIIFL